MIVDAKIVFKPDEGNVIAVANIALDGVFVIRGVRLVDGRYGSFVSFPVRKNKEGEYVDICYPITADLREAIHAAIEDALDRERDKKEAPKSQKRSYKRK